MKTRAEIARYLSDRLDFLLSMRSTDSSLDRFSELGHAFEACFGSYKAGTDRREIVRQLEEEEESHDRQ